MVLPPLRERKEDLPALVAHFLRRAARELDKPVVAVAADAMQLITAHDWHGNVRELRSAIEYAVVLAPGEVVTPDCLPAGTREPRIALDTALGLARSLQELLQAGGGDIYDRVGAAVDTFVLTEALRLVRGNVVQASKLLGIARNTFKAKARALGIAPASASEHGL